LDTPSYMRMCNVKVYVLKCYEDFHSHMTLKNKSPYIVYIN